MYHFSKVPPEIILKEGLSRKSKGLTKAGSWAIEEGWLPENVIFLSRDPPLPLDGYVYRVNVKGLDLLPDYPALVDLGAFVWEEYMYWPEGEVPERLRDRHDPYWGVYYKHITAEDTLALTGTAAVEGPIFPWRIVYESGKDSNQ